MGDITEAEYSQGSSLPDLWVSWRDAAGKLIPFASQPHTFTMRMANRKTPAVAAFTKVAGFTGYDSSPNLSVGWIAGQDISVLVPGMYDGVIEAERTADNKLRKLEFSIRIKRTPGAALGTGAPDPPE